MILYGLLWLIVYDALFVMGYVDLWLGAALLLLWPIAYLAVRAMRVWASVTDLARKPRVYSGGRVEATFTRRLRCPKPRLT